MSRRELREQIFKFIFRVEFNDMEEMAQQEQFFFEDVDYVERNVKEKDTEYISKKANCILEKLEEIATSFEGVEKSFAIQAGREIRVIVSPDKVSDDEMTLKARDICKKIEDELDYPGQIKVNVIRETRATDVAK